MPPSFTMGAGRPDPDLNINRRMGQVAGVRLLPLLVVVVGKKLLGGKNRR